MVNLSFIHDNVNFIGKLERNETNYIITNVQIISTLGFIEYEDKEKGILKHDTIRGGEIKQFVNGGEALTLAGSGDMALAKSVFQNLVGFENYPLSLFPGYEETTIISPDGKLGLVMTTRFSPKTSSEILGYMPRPLCVYSLRKINRYVYFYGVKKFVKLDQEILGQPLLILKNQDQIHHTWAMIFIKKDGLLNLLYLGIQIVKKECSLKLFKMVIIINIELE